MLYMNQNVNNMPRTNNIRPTANNQKKGPVKGNSTFTENWVKIKSIRNGIITLPNKERVTVLKLNQEIFLF